ncbi:hypothetical protein H4217_005449 [Coemansia sp. RSA 1939]|nr:hypothetical protein H4217_005449 [Coemansia sp. RSA 1939]
MANAQQNVHACACLNVRVNVQDTAEQRTTLEDIENVLECTLDSSAIHVELSALVEVVPGSSIDRKISAVRCLLCKVSVAYFESPSPSSQTAAPAAMPHIQPGQRQMPAPFTTVYLPSSTKNPDEVRTSIETPEYSQPFGVLLQPALSDAARSRHNIHIPREMQQKSAEFMQKQESDKNERVRDFIRKQDEELERIHRRTTEECNILAEIISKTHPQSPATSQPAHQGRSGSSGLAAMLRSSTAGAGGSGSLGRGLSGSGSGSGSGGPGSMPFAALSPRGAISRPGADSGPGDSFDDEFDGDDLHSNVPKIQVGYAGGPSSGIGRQIGSHRTPSRQSGGYSDDLEHEEREFGDFADDDRGAGAQGAASRGMNFDQNRLGPGGAGGSNLGQMLAGSMPIQIPRFGSNSLAAGGFSMSRQEYHQRADERDTSRRREQMLRGLPKTFVPPHQLLDQIHDNDIDMLLVGSKPRDSYGLGRRHAPG